MTEEHEYKYSVPVEAYEAVLKGNKDLPEPYVGPTSKNATFVCTFDQVMTLLKLLGPLANDKPVARALRMILTHLDFSLTFYPTSVKIEKCSWCGRIASLRRDDKPICVLCDASQETNDG